MQADQQKIICASAAVESGGTGFRFNLISNEQSLPAFVIRFEGVAYAYLNRCAHLMLQLDWDDGEYYDADGEYIICSNHGALFEPNTGLCVNGPCYGASLASVAVQESEANIVLADERFELDRQEG